MGVSGFDIGGTKILSGCLHDDEVVLNKKEQTPDSFDVLIDCICEKIKLHRTVTDISAVGIGIAGAVDDNGELWCPNIPAASGKPFAEILEERCGLKVFLENDAHAALRGEMWKGALKDSDNAALVSVGTGIGAAVLVNGKVIGGKHDVAGACGWILTRDIHGQLRHYEELASGEGLNRIANEIGLTSFELVSACRNGDKRAYEQFSIWADYLAEGIASIASIYDVDTVAIGGGLSKEFDLFEETIKNHISDYASPLVKKVIIKKAELSDLACLYGAISLAMQKITRR